MVRSPRLWVRWSRPSRDIKTGEVAVAQLPEINPNMMVTMVIIQVFSTQVRMKGMIVEMEMMVVVR